MRQAWHGGARLGGVGQDKAGNDGRAWRGGARPGGVRQGKAGGVGQGTFRLGMVRLGRQDVARRG